MAALWDLATPQERREMVLLMLEPAGLYYDLEQKIIAALKPRPAFLPILRMLGGIVEYDEARGLLLVERWQDRNRRASVSLSPTLTLFLAPQGKLYLRLQQHIRMALSWSHDLMKEKGHRLPPNGSFPPLPRACGQ